MLMDIRKNIGTVYTKIQITFKNWYTKYTKIEIIFKDFLRMYTIFFFLTTKTRYEMSYIVISAPRDCCSHRFHLLDMCLSRNQFRLIVLCDKLQERAVGWSILVLRPLPEQAVSRDSSLRKA